MRSICDTRLANREISRPPPARQEPFAGFARPSSNATYCPNQFFDIVLPNFSRGAVRLVGYVLYRTFAWSGKDGRPLREQHPISYRELVEQAGISRGALHQAIQEAVEGNLLRRVRSGRAARRGAASETSVFELKWHDGEYTSDPSRFLGFFEGSGHRTYIPNQFFTRLLPNEPLSVLKVVGAIIRFSIGFEVKRGFRRQQVSLSYSAIQRYSHISSRQDLAIALKHALTSNFIERTTEGRFNRTGRGSEAATYGLRWESDDLAAQQRFKIRTGTQRDLERGSPETVPVPRFNPRTGSGSESVPAMQFRNRTGSEITVENKPCKQQQAAAAPSEEYSARLRCLQEAGFDSATATRLAEHRLERIQRQIDWMGQRNPTRNRLGMLRRAIEEDWSAPASTAGDLSPVVRFARHFYAGLARNPETPVSLPSSIDQAAAEPLVRALCSMVQGNTSVEAWGLQFGQYAAQQGGADGQGLSLAGAVRRFGDAFVVWARRTREKQTRESEAQRRVAYAARIKPEYTFYLLEAEAKLREEEPSRYKAFLDQREERRRTLLRFGTQSALLRAFDSESARLEDLAAFFSDEVLDFASWGHQRNDDETQAMPESLGSVS